MTGPLDRAVQAYEAAGGNISQAARDLNIPRSTLQSQLERAGVDNKPLTDGRVKLSQMQKRKLPQSGQVKRYIITSAQNNTKVNKPVWQNLLALAERYDAEILVGTFTYNKNAYGKLSVKRGSAKAQDGELWYDPLINDYIVDERVQIAPALHWCGEMNILPTAVDPLSGFETYNHRASGIFPHAKFAMRSIAAGTKSEPTKFTYTTGCTTQMNYVQKRAGLRAEHHHGYGGLVVEVNHKGEWWVRQLHASSNGQLYDLDILVEDGVVHENVSVAAITWGDIHELMLDHKVDEAAWGEYGMLNALKPKRQFIHDVLLGSVTNHWESKNPHSKFRRFALGGGFSSIYEEFASAADFLERAHRDWCQTFVVDSNHDRPWIERWLQDSSGHSDSKNAIVWHQMNAALLEAIQRAPRDPNAFHALEHAILEVVGMDHEPTFLKEDESFTITNSKIECGMHGHLGPNGSRGAPRNLAKLGRRANVGHYHSAGIWDGLYAAGSAATLDMIYNRGPSSWSHSHVVTYPNGKRTIVTVWHGKWRA